MNKGIVYDTILHKKSDNIFTPQEIDIMNIFTSPKWSSTTYLGHHSVVNMAETKGTQINKKLISTESKEAVNIEESDLYRKNIYQEKHSINENKNIFKKSDGSSQLLLKKKKTCKNESEESSLKRIMYVDKKTGSHITCLNLNEDDIFNDLLVNNDKLSYLKNDSKLEETISLRNPNNIENEDSYNKIFSEEQETLVNRKSQFTYQPSSKGRYFNKNVINTDLNDINNKYNSETMDSSSSCSLNTSTVTQCIISQAQSSDLITEKQKKDLVINKGVELIIKKAKMSLGTFLVEGSYEVSRNYRHDPFRSLGIWLLIQADIRDEHKIGQESLDSCDDLSMTKNINRTLQ